MDQRRENPALENLIREAWTDREGCPPPEAYTSASASGLSSGRRKELNDHAEGCPACAAERELARAFEVTDEELADHREQLKHIVAGIAAQSPLRARAGGATPGSGRGKGSGWYSRGLAAAAVVGLALVGGWLATRSPAPGLPEIGTDPILRGSRIEIIRPVGEVQRVPDGFHWKTVEGTTGYRVRLIAVDEEILWEAIVADSPAQIPPNFHDRLHPAVVYSWTVEALAPDGSTLARSERSSFRVDPGARRGDR